MRIYRNRVPWTIMLVAWIMSGLTLLLTRWYLAGHGYDEQFFHRMPGHAFGGWAEMWTWWSTAAAKMVVGESLVAARCPRRAR